jgi:hypothetical protein
VIWRERPLQDRCGQGFPRSEAAKLFGNLGGSWKRLTRRTKTKSRMVHRQEGRGRYKAFALGRSVVWKVCYLDSGRPRAFDITLMESDLRDVVITEERDAAGQAGGVVVEICEARLQVARIGRRASGTCRNVCPIPATEMFQFISPASSLTLKRRSLDRQNCRSQTSRTLMAEFTPQSFTSSSGARTQSALSIYALRTVSLLIGSNSEIRAGNREVCLAFKIGHREPGL